MPIARRSAGGADVDRHHRAQAGLAGSPRRARQQPAQPAGGRGQDDVVDRSAERVLDLLQLLQLDGEHREPASRADRPVEAGLRRRDQLVADDQLGEGRGATGGVPGALGWVAIPTADSAAWRPACAGPQGRVADGQVGPREQGGGAPPAPIGVTAVFASVLGGRPFEEPFRAVRPLALGVEQDGRHVDRADPVDHAVVGLGDHRPAPVGQLEDAISHSGFVRSSRCEKYSPAHSISSSTPPGAGRPAT